VSQSTLFPAEIDVPSFRTLPGDKICLNPRLGAPLSSSPAVELPIALEENWHHASEKEPRRRSDKEDDAGGR
jgi:hypothetical protein